MMTWARSWAWLACWVALPLALAFTYQIFIPGLAATILWFALVKRVGAVRASTFHFMNPFFGVTISALLLGEAISKTDIAGVLIAMAGILAVQMSRLRKLIEADAAAPRYLQTVWGVGYVFVPDEQA